MSVLETSIGWLAPVSCVGCGSEGSALCTGCNTSKIPLFGERCAYCGRLSPRARTCEHCRQPGTPRFVWVNTDYQALAQDLVQTYKFGHVRAAAAPIAALMIQSLLRIITPAQLKTLNYLVVPLPTATSRIRQRSFDHSSLLAKAIAKELGMELGQPLGRLGQSRQLGSSRQARLAQQSNHYFARHPQRIAGRNILLIDDVITTGGSLIAATKTLRAAGAAHVDALVFAKRL